MIEIGRFRFKKIYSKKVIGPASALKIIQHLKIKDDFFFFSKEL